MSFDNKIEFTKENIDLYLKDLAYEYRKMSKHRESTEIILVGGASILINYGFRNMTSDIDAIIHSTSLMKEAINHVGERYNLPTGWLNQDFVMTQSYSSTLIRISKYYKNYFGVLTVRTVDAEYLIAMKLKSGRQYKSDLSDIIGILSEHSKHNNPITLDQIKKAVIELYGKWEALPASSCDFIINILKNNDYETMYEQIVHQEHENKSLLINFENDYPNVLEESNVDEIINKLQNKNK